ncbi:unnamed protein product, partial [Closterium sp. NIES-54]
NNLEGPIPESFSALTALTLLSLSVNQLNSSIPAKLKSLQRLASIDLNNNKLSGSIAPLASLRGLDTMCAPHSLPLLSGCLNA